MGIERRELASESFNLFFGPAWNEILSSNQSEIKMTWSLRVGPQRGLWLRRWRGGRGQTDACWEAQVGAANVSSAYCLGPEVWPRAPGLS